MKVLKFHEFINESKRSQREESLQEILRLDQEGGLYDNNFSMNEGGAAGHMPHPFEDWSLTFADIRHLIERGLEGDLNFEHEPVEKTDGQNLFATVVNGEARFARNVGETKNTLSQKELAEKFQDHPSPLVRDTFAMASADLAKTLPKLPAKTLELFNDGKSFMNMEIINSKNPNVIHYDLDVIQFHDIKHTDGAGNVTSEDRKPAKDFAKILKDINSDIGDHFTIIPPQVIMLAKDIEFDKNKAKFLKKLDAIQRKFDLKDSDEVARYHEATWRETIDKTFPSLEQDVKEGLLQRWAYDNKKALDWRSLSKNLSKEDADNVKKFDKENVRKVYKENMRPVEDLFLELGAVILKNASNFLGLSPDREKQRIQALLRKEAENVKKTGDEKSIQKVAMELDRLSRIGGIESIIPTEGLVFTYKGKTFKLTGTYAATNQLMGIIKYGGR